MAFDDLEQSKFDGAPITLVRFTSDAVDDAFCYTDVVFDVTYNSEQYTPLAMAVGSISSSGTLDKSTLDLDLPGDSAVPMLFRYYPLGGVVGLTIFYGHEGSDDFKAVWVGRITQCSWDDAGATATLSCEPASTSMARVGLRRNYQRLCPHALYDGESCRADRTAHTKDAVVQSVTGGTIKLDAVLPDATQFKGGTVRWTRNLAGQIPLMDMRMVKDVVDDITGTEIVALGVVLGLSPGDTIEIAHGCDHSLDTCGSVFHNAPNYGGQPWIPTDNPSSGGSIY